MTGKTFNWAGHKSFALVLVALSVALAAIASAWFIELVLAVRPCPLCLEQRLSYYAGIPLACLLLVLLRDARRHLLIKPLLAVLCLCFLFGAGLGVYHAGVEWALWPGPGECSGQLAPMAGAADLLSQLDRVKVVRCDQVSFRLLGQSLAVWNVMVAGFVAVVTGLAFLIELKRDHGSNSLSQ
jgi:disulfide bond formation protein DsbB